jgi:integrase
VLDRVRAIRMPEQSPSAAHDATYERTRTADLPSLRVINRALQGFARGCKSRISKPLLLLCLAAYCTVLRSRWCKSGVNRGIGCFTILHSRSTHPKLVQYLLGHASIQLTFDCQSHWTPSVGGATAVRLDEALG